jgi:hypothetical protein
MQTSKNLTRCDFCIYKTLSGCMVTPSHYYCKAANDEYYQYLQSKKTGQQSQKSLKPWDKKR